MNSISKIVSGIILMATASFAFAAPMASVFRFDNAGNSSVALSTGDTLVVSNLVVGGGNQFNDYIDQIRVGHIGWNTGDTIQISAGSSSIIFDFDNPVTSQVVQNMFDDDSFGLQWYQVQGPAANRNLIVDMVATQEVTFTMLTGSMTLTGFNFLANPGGTMRDIRGGSAGLTFNHTSSSSSVPTSGTLALAILGLAGLRLRRA